MFIKGVYLKLSEGKMIKDGEFEFGAYIGCAVLCWIFTVIIIMLGGFVLIFERTCWEEFLPLLCFLLTLSIGLGICYTYQCKKYIKNEGRKEKEI